MGGGGGRKIGICRGKNINLERDIIDGRKLGDE